MNTKDVDFTKVSIPADEFDAMMRRALDAPAPRDTSTKHKVQKLATSEKDKPKKKA